MGASAFLGSTASGALRGMANIAWVSLALGCIVPVGALLLERQLRARDAVS